ncbi:hypothetical protein ES705_31874 [subsurface metagenome]
MSPKYVTSHPHLPEDESFVDILDFLDNRTKDKSIDTLFSDGHIDRLLAAEGIRQLQTIAFESSRIADSLKNISTRHAQISEDFNCLINTDLPSLADRFSDLLTGLLAQLSVSFISQFSETRIMLHQELDDLIFSNRDMVGTLSLILKKLPDLEEE